MTTSSEVSLLYMTIGREQNVFNMGELAHQQIASRLQIPYRYYQKMQREFPELLDENVNGWFNQQPERRMIRTLDGKVRAFLSDRYRRLDNLELCAAVLPIIQEMKGADIASCDVTETHMYLKVVHNKMKAEVAVGDVVQAGFVISSSEVGLGRLRVEPVVFCLVCKNGIMSSSAGLLISEEMNRYADKDFENEKWQVPPCRDIRNQFKRAAICSL